MEGVPFLDRLRDRDRGPTAALLGHRLLECDANEGRVRVAYLALPSFCNPMGQVQGGFQSAMLEQAMIDAVYAAAGLDAGPVTLELETHFLAPASPGPMFAEGRVARLGRSVAFLSGQLQDEAGNLLLSGSAVALLQPRTGTGD